MIDLGVIEIIFKYFKIVLFGEVFDSLKVDFYIFFLLKFEVISIFIFDVNM